MGCAGPQRKSLKPGAVRAKAIAGGELDECSSCSVRDGSIIEWGSCCNRGDDCGEKSLGTEWAPGALVGEEAGLECGGNLSMQDPSLPCWG